MVSVRAGCEGREEGLVGTGWNRLQPAVVGPASPWPSLSLRTESARGSPGTPVPSAGGWAWTRAPERRPVAARGLRPQAPWAALRPHPASSQVVRCARVGRQGQS